MAKLMVLIAVAFTLDACSLSGGGTTGSRDPEVTSQRICQTGGLGCG